MEFVNRMKKRIETATEESNTAGCLHLMYLGEMVLKLTVLSLVSMVEDDVNRSKYRLLYRLVRADGLGEWNAVLDEILIGPSAAALNPEAYDIRSELIAKNPRTTWQYDCVENMNQCLVRIKPKTEPLSTKTDLRKFFSIFVEIRNSTRAHGATPTMIYSQIYPFLKEGYYSYIDNAKIFTYQWAFLYRNLSGKYRVSSLTESSDKFSVLKNAKSKDVLLDDGIYIYIKRPIRIELLFSDVDLVDLYIPNGAFKNQKYEVISYITANTHTEDATKFTQPTVPLPKSETHGYGILDVRGKSFTNIPPVQKGYVVRPELEKLLLERLTDHRHPIISLVGRGGIGKTWLALYVIDQMAYEGFFDAIIWFSSRDIDLLATGPKAVTPRILCLDDVAKEYYELVQPSSNIKKGKEQVEFLSQEMEKSEIGKILFVFDNFETIKDPIGLYTWIDTYIRLPNKVLITSRTRDFKGDWPIEVSGMEEGEFFELVKSVAVQLGINQMITNVYRAQLYSESNGHPYVARILLGEVAKHKKIQKIERLMASRDDLLEALFERTYSALSPAARRVFLTVCQWRSSICVFRRT